MHMGGQIIITGTISCLPADLDLLLSALPDHVSLTRSERGCLTFSIEQSSVDPCVFDVSERFVDQAAFELHTQRTRASDWWQKTNHMPRNISINKP